jgi:hypothetical protein
MLCPRVRQAGPAHMLGTVVAIVSRFLFALIAVT